MCNFNNNDIELIEDILQEYVDELDITKLYKFDITNDFYKNKKTCYRFIEYDERIAITFIYQDIYNLDIKNIITRFNKKLKYFGYDMIIFKKEKHDWIGLEYNDVFTQSILIIKQNIT